MKAINLSKEIIAAYKNASVDISYALAELMGAVSYDKATQITYTPMEGPNPISYDIDDSAFEALNDKFDSLEDVSSVAEILLWGNYFMGARL